MRYVRKFHEDKNYRSDFINFFRNSSNWIEQGGSVTSYKSSKTGTYVKISSSMLIIQDQKVGISIHLYWGNIEYYRFNRGDVEIYVKGSPQPGLINLF